MIGWGGSVFIPRTYVFMTFRPTDLEGRDKGNGKRSSLSDPTTTTLFGGLVFLRNQVSSSCTFKFLYFFSCSFAPWVSNLKEKGVPRLIEKKGIRTRVFGEGEVSEGATEVRFDWQNLSYECVVKYGGGCELCNTTLIDTDRDGGPRCEEYLSSV